MGVPLSTDVAVAGSTLTPKDEATEVVTGALASATAGGAHVFFGAFNVVLWVPTAFSGTVAIERSFDGGTTWIVINDPNGTAGNASYTTFPVSRIIDEPEQGVGYRVNCTAFTSGSINYRLSTTARAGSAWGVPV